MTYFADSFSTVNERPAVSTPPSDDTNRSAAPLGESTPASAPPAPAPTPPAPAAPAAPAAGQPYPTAAPGYAYPPAPPTNTLAIVSFVAALIGFLVIPLLASIAAVITGHISLKQISARGEGGRNLALAGTIIGWVGVGIWIILTILFIVWIVALMSIGAASGYYA